jgi:hypothetical protein
MSSFPGEQYPLWYRSLSKLVAVHILRYVLRDVRRNQVTHCTPLPAQLLPNDVLLEIFNAVVRRSVRYSSPHTPAASHHSAP